MAVKLCVAMVFEKEAVVVGVGELDVLVKNYRVKLCSAIMVKIGTP